MVNSTRICKVCGREYPYCKTVLKDGDIFRWQDVACCPAHGSEYFAQILASRSGEAPVAKNEPVVADDEGYLEDEDGDEYELDFDDSEEDIDIVTD